MKYILVRPVLAALFLITIAFGSCDKQDNGVGIGLFSRDNDLGIAYIDTFLVTSVSVNEDAIQSSGFTDVLLGSYHDPFFGNTKVSFYTQFLIQENGISFSDSAICDSVVFYAKLGVSNGDQFYGPENKEMTFNVHRINNDAIFTKDSIYYTNSSIDIFNESLLNPSFNNTFTPNFTDTIQIGLDTLAQFPGVLKLKIDSSFGQGIIDLSGTEVLSSNEEFLKVYKGLYITTDGIQNGSILNIDQSSSATTMIMYMHIDTVVSQYEFTVTQSVVHFNEFKHDYVGSGSAEFNAILNDSTLGNTKYFVQAGNGFAVNIKMPTLHAITDSLGPIPINKAELILPIDPNTVNDFVPGNQLFISRFDENGTKLPIADNGSPNLGGQYNELNNEYRFIITNHIQDFLNGIISTPDVRVEINKPGTSPNRTILLGNKADTTNGGSALKLRIYYSTLKN